MDALPVILHQMMSENKKLASWGASRMVFGQAYIGLRRPICSGSGSPAPPCVLVRLAWSIRGDTLPREDD